MSALPPPSVDPARVRDAADEVLRRAEFADARESLLERLLREVLEALGGVASGASGSDVGVLVSWTLAAVAIGLLVVLGLRLARRRAGRPRLREARTTEPTGPRDWREEAARHEAAGRWRDAIRCRYRDAVASLAARGVLEGGPGRTTRDDERAVREVLPDAAAEFTALTDVFEEAWYGRRNVDEPAARAAGSLSRSIATAARR